MPPQNIPGVLQNQFSGRSCRPGSQEGVAMRGAKIIEGLRDAVAGNFIGVAVEGQTWGWTQRAYRLFA